MNTHGFHPVRVLKKNENAVYHLYGNVKPSMCSSPTKRTFICNQNVRMWAGGCKTDIKPHQLLAEWAKFALHVMVLATACISGKGHLYFVDEKAKVIAAYTTWKNCYQCWWKTWTVATKWFHLPARRRFSLCITGLAEIKVQCGPEPYIFWKLL